MIENGFNDIVVLSDGADNDIELSLLDIVEYQGKDYAMLVPLDETADADGVQEAIILRVKNRYDNGEYEFEGIDDVKTLDAVYDLFVDLFGEDA